MPAFINSFMSGWSPAGIKATFRSLGSRNYRLFFFGQSISLIGSWVQVIALPWLVYSMTDSIFLLGLISFVGQIPVFFLAPFAGVILDRFDRHKLLVWAHVLSLVQASLLTLLYYSGNMEIWHIVALSIFLGLLNAFEMPARQALVVDMIDRREDLGNAIALNSSMVNVARLLGPSLAGILISTAGEGVCFLINAISFVFVIASLLMMKLQKKKSAPPKSSALRRLKEGVHYTFGNIPLKYLLLMVAIVSMLAMPYSTLMPVFAKNVLKGGAHTFGFLMAASGVGSLVGAIYMASRKNVGGLLKLIPACIIVFAGGLIVFSFSRSFLFSFALMFISGIGMMIQMTANNTMIQTIADEEKRGRVMSFYTMAFIGTTPIGSLLAGWIADRIGAPYTLLIGGSVCLLCALLFLMKIPVLQKQLKNIFAQRGMMPGTL